MDHHVTCRWQGQLAFQATVAGHPVPLDARPQAGGQGHGTSPKQLLLAALAGCTGIDVAGIVAKMRLPVAAFHIDVDGELTTDHPRTYRRIHVTYTFTGDALDEARLQRAVALSWDQYCGVAAMLRQAATLTYEVRCQPLPDDGA